MGAGGASTGGGRGGVGPAGMTGTTTVAGKTKRTYGTAKDARRTSSRNQGRKAAREIGNFIKGGGVIGAIARGLSNNTGSAKSQANVEIGLGSDRMSNYSVGQGGTREGGGGQDRNNQPLIIKKTAGGQTIQTTAPTQAEVSQSAAADAEAYDLRKTKKRGRSMTILSSSKGTRPTDKLTLGKPSLLGQ